MRTRYTSAQYGYVNVRFRYAMCGTDLAYAATLACYAMCGTDRASAPAYPTAMESPVVTYGMVLPVDRLKTARCLRVRHYEVSSAPLSTYAISGTGIPHAPTQCPVLRDPRYLPTCCADMRSSTGTATGLCHRAKSIEPVLSCRTMPWDKAMGHAIQCGYSGTGMGQRRTRTMRLCYGTYYIVCELTYRDGS
eukprot:2373848-Rhodomonas_salina.1